MWVCYCVESERDSGPRTGKNRQTPLLHDQMPYCSWSVVCDNDSLNCTCAQSITALVPLHSRFTNTYMRLRKLGQHKLSTIATASVTETQGQVHGKRKKRNPRPIQLGTLGKGSCMLAEQ